MSRPVGPKPQRLRPTVAGVLAIGSNLGDREGNILAAIADLDRVPGISVETVSGLVETPALKPQGVAEDAPRYLNAVLTIQTTLEPLALLDAVNTIEDKHGRVRTERWGDRTLDIDIIDVAGLRIATDRLELPHPRAWQRAFVLAPWHEIAPDAIVPGRGRIDTLLEKTTDQVRPYQSGAAQNRQEQ